MTREWGPSGVGYPSNTSTATIDDDDWEQIVIVVTPYIAASSPKSLLVELRRDLERALETYYIVKHQMKDTSIAVVRKNTSRLNERVTKLRKHMEQLDMNSRLLLSEAGGTPFHQWFREILELENQSNRAEALASEYPGQGGQPKDHAMLNMANQLALALAKHVGAPAITPNPDGVFGNILVILLRIARGSADDPDPGRITRSAYDFYISCQGDN